MTDKRITDAEFTEHQIIEAHGSTLGPFIQDIVYGGNDGIVTTFAVVAGSMGADLSPMIIIVLGVANLLADGTSMGTGAYLSLRSERDQYRRIRKEELSEIERIPHMEREEIRRAYAAKGFKGANLEMVVDTITSNKDVWADTMMWEEHQMSPQMYDKPFLHGAMTFIAFVIFGIIPLLPYLFDVAPDQRFKVAIYSTSLALIVLGLTRSYVTRERLFRGPLEVLSVGALGAIVAYIVGYSLKELVGIAL
jgi:vacuolar iron transporter family protein